MKIFYYLLLLQFSLLFSNIYLNGFYEGQFGKAYESDVFAWNMWDPNFYLESRLHGSPTEKSDFYLKFYSSNNYQLSERPLAVLSEGHIGFKDEKNGVGFKAVLFTRESQHYWIDGSMLGLINTGSINNDGNGQGARLDLWHAYNGSLTYVLSDFSQGSGDDIHILKYRQSMFSNKVNSGFSIQQKNYSSGYSDDYNQVIAYDLKINSGKYYFNTEFAVSHVPSDSYITNLTDSYTKKEFFKSNIALKSELRGFRFGRPNLGYWFFVPGIFSYGNTFRNYMGDNQSNRHGYWLNSYLLLPERAITIVINYNRSKKIVADTINVFLDSVQSKEIFDPIQSLYTEIYIEFINGFKAKIGYNKMDEEWQGVMYKHYDSIFEISVENRLAKLLGQYKIKDIGQIWEKHILGIELGVNLNERWRLFTRGLIADDRVAARFSIFTELQYRAGGNTELYLQYGPSYWGQYGLVNDDGFVSSGTMRKEMRLIVKGWF